MVIDAHIHPVVDAETDFSRFVATGDFEAQVETLRRAGMDRACGALVARTPFNAFAPVRQLNDHALRLRDRFPDFYIPGVQVHPGYAEESCAELERLHREGVRWVGELVGYIFGYGEEYASPRALAVMRTAAALGMVVNLHCGSLEVVDALAQAVPELPIVLAHPGDGEAFLSRIALVARHPNLHLDISGTGIDRYGMIRRAMDAAGKHKILLGSDYPVNNPAVYLEGARFEPLRADEFEALCSGNFLRLIGG